MSNGVVFVTLLPQEDYVSKVKSLLGKALNLENGEEPNGKTNGLSNGSHKGEDAGMDVEEEDEALKSPSARGKGRKSKADTKSWHLSLRCSSFQWQLFLNFHS